MADPDPFATDPTVAVADQHRTKAEQAAARMGSYVEAVTTVLAAEGWRLYVGHGRILDKAYTVLAVDRTPDTPHPFPPPQVDGSDTASLSSQWEYWACDQGQVDWQESTNLLGRYHLLDTAVTTLTDEHAAPMTMAEAFEDETHPSDGTEALDGMQVALLQAWWDDRMAEGHTPASARLMLSLTLPTRLVARITYDPAGTPSLHPLR